MKPRRRQSLSKSSLSMIRRKGRTIAKAVRVIAVSGVVALIGADAGPRAAFSARAHADPVSSREPMVEVAYLYKFAKLTAWPTTSFADPRAPVRLCILGEDPFGPALKSIEGKTVGQRKLLIQRLAADEGVDRCHVLFVSASEDHRFARILGSVKDAPVLTISDIPGFAQAGGIINIETVDDRIRFQINAGAAERAGLTLSSELLTQAAVRQGAQDEAAGFREYVIKAAFLYNFAKFTTWPRAALSDPGAPLNVCVLGEDPFGLALESIEGKMVKERKLLTRHLAGAKGVDRCHLLFISASETERLDWILKSLNHAPVLTISDMPGFAQAGGVIGLKTIEDKIRFEINMAAAERAGLRLSSKLLSLAEIVGDGPRAETN
jgi:hypothetical protein